MAVMLDFIRILWFLMPFVLCLSSVKGIEYFNHPMTARSALGPLPSHRDSINDRSFASWSEWSECSRTCGTGISMRIRTCQRRSSGSSGRSMSSCRGDTSEHKICKLKDCPLGSPDYKHFQCSQYNNRPVAGHLGRIWIPATGSKGQNPCELRCQATEEKLVYSFGKVADGTPCFPTERKVCLDGRCLSLGCDERLGSEVTVDMCGVCGGRNTSCIHYKDVYLGQPSVVNSRGATADANGTWIMRTLHRDYSLDVLTQELHRYNLDILDLQETIWIGKVYRSEYREVVVIPIGARNLRVRQSIGNNYLAMQDRSNGVIFNGERALTNSGGHHYLAGTTVSYTRPDNITEVLTASGQTTQDLYVLVLLREKNPGIYYEYWLSKDRTQPKRSYPTFQTASPARAINVPVFPSNTRTTQIPQRTTPVPWYPRTPKPENKPPWSDESPILRETLPPAKVASNYPRPTVAAYVPSVNEEMFSHDQSRITSSTRQSSTIRDSPDKRGWTPQISTTAAPKPAPTLRGPGYKPKYPTPKTMQGGYYQNFRYNNHSINGQANNFEVSRNIISPVFTQRDSSNYNNRNRYRNPLVNVPTVLNKSRGSLDQQNSLQIQRGTYSSSANENNPHYVHQNNDVNSRWAYTWGAKGDKFPDESAKKGHLAPTPVTIAVLPLPETFTNNTTKSRKKKQKNGKKRVTKPRLTRGGLCEPCQKIRDQTKHFCQSDFVIRASIVGYEFFHGETRYELEVLQSFKNTLALLPREYVWSPDTCRCPKLRIGREYILMGRSDSSYRKNESRLLVDKHCFVRSYNLKYARRLQRLRKEQSRKCKKVS